MPSTFGPVAVQHISTTRWTMRAPPTILKMVIIIISYYSPPSFTMPQIHWPLELFLENKPHTQLKASTLAVPFAWITTFPDIYGSLQVYSSGISSEAFPKPHLWKQNKKKKTKNLTHPPQPEILTFPFCFIFFYSILK